MKSISGQISDEAYRVIYDYKLDHKVAKIPVALDKILIEYKKLKGGTK